MDYPINHFITYAATIREEMTKRGYKTMDSVWNKITAVYNDDYNLLPLNEIFSEWMNDTYFTICYYNLMEKWLRGGISFSEWQKIEDYRLNFYS